jgi:hypothetical protein
MKFTGQYRHLAMMAGAAAAVLSTEAVAQTVTVDMDVQVQNALTLTVVDNMDFGVIAAIDNNNAKVATIELDALTGLGAPTNDSPAVIFVVDNTNASQALIEIEDGANNATINVDIPAASINLPTLAGNTFALTGWETAYNNAGAPSARTPGTPWTETFLAGFGGGTNTLKIGVTIKTTDVVYGDGNYDGGFQVTFSY